MAHIPTDAEIVAESLRRPEAFAELFDRHHDRIHHFVSRRLGSDVAGDIASETFLVAFRRRGAYDTAYLDAAPWLLGIAVRLSRAHRRTERRHLRGPLVHESPGDHDPMATLHERLGPDELRALRGAIAGLRRGEREAFALHALADLTYAEIARALGVAPGTVASRIARARARAMAAIPELRPGARTTIRREEVIDG